MDGCSPEQVEQTAELPMMKYRGTNMQCSAKAVGITYGHFAPIELKYPQWQLLRLPTSLQNSQNKHWSDAPHPTPLTMGNNPVFSMLKGRWP